MPLNEAEIKAEIEQRKLRANELGVARVVFRLWDEHLKYLQPDFDHETKCMPKSLTKVARKSESDRWYSLETVELFFEERSISFTFYENRTALPDGEVFTSGDLIVKVEGKSVFDLRCSYEDVKYVGAKWSPGQIEGFIEGPWIDEVKKFEQQVSSLSGQRDKRLQSERAQSELNQLKEKFGL